MNQVLLREMNRIIHQAAYRARRRVRKDPNADLLGLWAQVIYRLSVIVSDEQLQFSRELSHVELQQLCQNKPWSYERFVDYVNAREVTS